MLGSVDTVLNNLQTSKRESTIKQIIEYGKHLDRVRKTEEHKNVISSREVIKHLIEYGMPLDLALEIQQAIDKE